MKKVLLSVKRYFVACDKPVLVLALACSLYGLVLIFSATRSYDSNRYILVQSAAAAIGIIGMFILSKMNYETLCSLWLPLIILSVALIAFTLVFGFGPSASSNNRNWISLGPVNVQPSEFVKLFFILSFASCLDRCRDEINKFKSLLRILPHFALYLALIYLQGDLGTVIVFAFIGICMIFVSGLKLRFFAAGAALVGAAAPFIWKYVFAGYMRDRIIYGFNPEGDPLGYGYQALQSKTAIGSGLFSGKGFLQGTLIQNELVPEKQTDFIFSVAGEEFGFIGSFLVIAMLAALMLLILRQAFKAKNNLGALVLFGVFAMFFAQTFENLGMCLGFLPVIGITLPFFSYGGSSILSSWLAIGLCMSVVLKSRSRNIGI